MSFLQEKVLVHLGQRYEQTSKVLPAPEMAVETARKSFITDVLSANKARQSSRDIRASGGRLRSDKAIARAVGGTSRASCASAA
jgi:hypothetical protein